MPSGVPPGPAKIPADASQNGHQRLSGRKNLRLRRKSSARAGTLRDSIRDGAVNRLQSFEAPAAHREVGSIRCMMPSR